MRIKIFISSLHFVVRGKSSTLCFSILLILDLLLFFMCLLTYGMTVLTSLGHALALGFRGFSLFCWRLWILHLCLFCLSYHLSLVFLRISISFQGVLLRRCCLLCQSRRKLRESWLIDCHVRVKELLFGRVFSLWGRRSCWGVAESRVNCRCLEFQNLSCRLRELFLAFRIHIWDHHSSRDFEEFHCCEEL